MRITTILKIGLTIPGNWSFEIRRISCEIRTKSAGFHVKSVQNPPDFMNVSFWVITKYRSFFRKTKHINQLLTLYIREQMFSE